MRINLKWTGEEYNSIENCIITRTDTGIEAGSVITGRYEHQLFRVEYLIRTSSSWETTFFELKTLTGSNKKIFSCSSDGKGSWQTKGKANPQFNDCIDIDISLTPFTNSLAINRLKLGINENREIKVLYLDIIGNEIKTVKQKYTRLSETDYKFENVPNDFEAVISVDESGLVKKYPGLFLMQERNEDA